MAEFSVPVLQIKHPVVKHPNADRLTITRILGFEAISNLKEDGTPRYKEGDYVVYIPEGALLPEWLLRKLDMWNEAAGKGFLHGPLGNRVKGIFLRQVLSQGVLMPVEFDDDNMWVRVPSIINGEYVGDTIHDVTEGQDVAAILGIEKYSPPIPIEMAGEVCAIFGNTMRYDFENWQKVPDLIADDEIVAVTEKLNGTHCSIGMVPGLNNSELFGNGDIYVSSKGLGAQGLVFKNTYNNAGNVYVKALLTFLENGGNERLQDLSQSYDGATVHIFGEVYGGKIQAFGYGLKQPELRIFDIAINGKFLPHDEMIQTAQFLGLKTVPILYVGPFNADHLMQFRDGLEPGVKVKGKDALTGTTLREGIVVKAADGSRHPHYGRKIMKMINPKYLDKSTGEEFN